MQSYYCAIEQLPGLKPTEIELLRLHSIVDTKELLARGATLPQRQTLAILLKLKLERVNKLLVLADLARVPQINCRYCGLVLHSGIVSVSQLANTSVGHLHQQVVRLSIATTHSKSLCPSIEVVKQWVDEARLLSKSPKSGINKLEWNNC